MDRDDNLNALEQAGVFVEQETEKPFACFNQEGAQELNLQVSMEDQTSSQGNSVPISSEDRPGPEDLLQVKNKERKSVEGEINYAGLEEEHQLQKNMSEPAEPSLGTPDQEDKCFGASVSLDGQQQYQQQESKNGAVANEDCNLEVEGTEQSGTSEALVETEPSSVIEVEEEGGFGDFKSMPAPSQEPPAPSIQEGKGFCALDSIPTTAAQQQQKLEEEERTAKSKVGTAVAVGPQDDKAFGAAATEPKPGSAAGDDEGFGTFESITTSSQEVVAPNILSLQQMSQAYHDDKQVEEHEVGVVTSEGSDAEAVRRAGGFEADEVVAAGDSLNASKVQEQEDFGAFESIPTPSQEFSMTDFLKVGQKLEEAEQVEETNAPANEDNHFEEGGRIGEFGAFEAVGLEPSFGIPVKDGNGFGAFKGIPAPLQEMAALDSLNDSLDGQQQEEAGQEEAEEGSNMEAEGTEQCRTFEAGAAAASLCATFEQDERVGAFDSMSEPLFEPDANASLDRQKGEEPEKQQQRADTEANTNKDSNVEGKGTERFGAFKASLGSTVEEGDAMPALLQELAAPDSLDGQQQQHEEKEEEAEQEKETRAATNQDTVEDEGTEDLGAFEGVAAEPALGAKVAEADDFGAFDAIYAPSQEPAAPDDSLDGEQQQEEDENENEGEEVAEREEKIEAVTGEETNMEFVGNEQIGTFEATAAESCHGATIEEDAGFGAFEAVPVIRLETKMEAEQEEGQNQQQETRASKIDAGIVDGEGIEGLRASEAVAAELSLVAAVQKQEGFGAFESVSAPSEEPAAPNHFDGQQQQQKEEEEMEAATDNNVEGHGTKEDIVFIVQNEEEADHEEKTSAATSEDGNVDAEGTEQFGFFNAGAAELSLDAAVEEDKVGLEDGAEVTTDESGDNVEVEGSESFGAFEASAEPSLNVTVQAAKSFGALEALAAPSSHEPAAPGSLDGQLQQQQQQKETRATTDEDGNVERQGAQQFGTFEEIAGKPSIGATFEEDADFGAFETVSAQSPVTNLDGQKEDEAEQQEGTGAVTNENGNVQGEGTGGLGDFETVANPPSSPDATVEEDDEFGAFESGLPGNTLVSFQPSRPEQEVSAVVQHGAGPENDAFTDFGEFESSPSPSGKQPALTETTLLATNESNGSFGKSSEPNANAAADPVDEHSKDFGSFATFGSFTAPSCAPDTQSHRTALLARSREAFALAFPSAPFMLPESPKEKGGADTLEVLSLGRETAPWPGAKFLATYQAAPPAQSRKAGDTSLLPPWARELVEAAMVLPHPAPVFGPDPEEVCYWDVSKRATAALQDDLLINDGEDFQDLTEGEKVQTDLSSSFIMAHTAATDPREGMVTGVVGPAPASTHGDEDGPSSHQRAESRSSSRSTGGSKLPQSIKTMIDKLPDLSFMFKHRKKRKTKQAALA